MARHDAICQIGAVEVADKNVGRLELQLGNDIGPHRFGSGRGEGVDRGLGKSFFSSPN